MVIHHTNALVVTSQTSTTSVEPALAHSTSGRSAGANRYSNVTARIRSAGAINQRPTPKTVCSIDPLINGAALMTIIARITSVATAGPSARAVTARILNGRPSCASWISFSACMITLTATETFHSAQTVANAIRLAELPAKI